MSIWHIDLMIFRKQKLKYMQVCKICGCTETTACFHPKIGPCFWIQEDLCSHCDATFMGKLEQVDINFKKEDTTRYTAISDLPRNWKGKKK